MADLVEIGFVADVSGINGTERGLDRLAGAGEKADKSLIQTSKTLSAIKGIVGTIGLTAAASQVLQYADAWQNVENVMTGVTSGYTDLISTQQKIIGLTKDTYSSLDATAGLYSALSRSTKDLGVNQDRLLGVTRTINNLFLAGGKSAESAAGAITQLNQGLAAGALRGDEFNSVAEGAPRILDAVAKYLNMTRGALRDFAAEGGITAEILIGALESYSDEAQRAADTTQRTFSQNSELARTFALEYVSASDSIAAFSGVAGEALVTLASNLDMVADSVTVVAAAVGAKLVVELARKTQATIAGIVATNAQIAAENSAALGVQRRAVAEQQYALAALKKAQAENAAAVAAVNMARASGITSAALTKQAQTQAALNAATTSYATTAATATAANARLAASSAAVGVAATAMRGAGAALALIGGPAGAAILAAGAIYYFATRATEAEKIVEKLNPEVDGLAERFKALGAAQQALARTEMAEAVEDQRDKIEGLKIQLDALNASVGRDSNGFFSDYQRDKIIEVSAELEGAQEELAKLQGQLDSVKVPDAEINKFITSLTGLNEVMGYFITGNSVATFSMIPPGTEKQIESVSDEYKKLAYEIQKQIDLKGDESESASLAYDIQMGMLGKLSVPEAERLVTLYKTKEAMDAAKTAAEKYADAVKNIESGEMADFERVLGAENKDRDEIKKQQEELKKADEEFQNYIDSIDEFGGAWTRSGSAVVDAVGSIIDVFDDYEARIIAITKAEEENARRKAETQDPEKLKKLYEVDTKLAKERTKAELANYRNMAGAAASFFKDGSKGRKAMHNIEMALSAVELAMAIKNTATELALSATRTAAATTETGVNVAAGGAKMFAQSGWGGFAGVAAMVAAMAALGFSGSGGGGGSMSIEDIQAAQGTGSVLGSNDKSESIANSFENFKEIEIDQLVELRGIRDAMTGISSGIAQLAVSFVAGGKFSGAGISGLGKSHAVSFADIGIIKEIEKYDPFGMALNESIMGAVFGSTKKKLKDTGLLFGDQSLGEIFSGQLEADYYNTIETTKKKLFGLSKKTKTKDELTDVDSAAAEEITSIFSFIGDAVTGSISSLGLQSEKSLSDFVLSIGKISFKDLSGEEIQKELEAVFSQQADLIAEFMLPQISKYQQMGEGAFETLTRVAKEQAIFNDYMDKMGLSMQGVSSLMAIDMAQSIAAMMGGFDNFVDAAGEYVDRFFTEEEKFNMLQDSLSETFAALGVTLPTTTDGFRKLVEEANKAGDTKLFAALLEINPAVADYIEGLDKMNEATQEAADKAQKAADDIVRAADTSAYNSMVKNLRQNRADLDKNLSSAEAALKRAFAAEKERLSAQDQANIKAIDESAQAEIAAINQAQEAKLSAIAESNAAQLSGLEAMKSAASEMGNNLRSLASSLFSAADSFGAQMIDRGAAFASLSGALASARSGDFSKALALGGNVDVLTSMKETDFSSAADFQVAQARAQFALSELAKLSSNQATVQDEIVASLQAQIDVAEVYGQAQIDGQRMYGEAMIAGITQQAEIDKAGYESQVDALDKQLNELLGIDDSVLSIDDAIAQFKSAQDAANAFNLESEIEKLDIARNQLGELQRINENLANQNIITQQQNNLAAEVVKLRESMESMQKEANDKLTGIARSTSASAQSLQNQEFANEGA